MQDLKSEVAGNVSVPQWNMSIGSGCMRRSHKVRRPGVPCCHLHDPDAELRASADEKLSFVGASVPSVPGKSLAGKV